MDARRFNGDVQNSVAGLNLNLEVTRPARVYLACATTAKTGDFRHQVVQERLLAVGLRQLLRKNRGMTQDRTDMWPRENTV